MRTSSYSRPVPSRPVHPRARRARPDLPQLSTDPAQGMLLYIFVDAAGGKWPKIILRGFSGTFTALQRLDENLLKLSGVSRKHGGRLDNSPRLYIAPITGYIVALFPARSPLKHAPLFIYKANTTTPPRCMRLPFVCVRELAACVYYLFVSMYSLYVSDVCVDVYVCCLLYTSPSPRD